VHRVALRLQKRGLRVLRPQAHSCGDAGLALGQAWAAAQQLVHSARRSASRTQPVTLSCV
jgi:hydrogenase maturation protein HypF